MTAHRRQFLSAILPALITRPALSQLPRKQRLYVGPGYQPGESNVQHALPRADLLVSPNGNWICSLDRGGGPSSTLTTGRHAVFAERDSKAFLGSYLKPMACCTSSMVQMALCGNGGLSASRIHIRSGALIRATSPINDANHRLVCSQRRRFVRTAENIFPGHFRRPNQIPTCRVSLQRVLKHESAAPSGAICSR